MNYKHALISTFVLAILVVFPISTNNAAKNLPDPIKILIVPGHEPDDGGAIYKERRERDIVMDITDKITTLLKGDERFEIIVARNKDEWNPIFSEYFEKNSDEIKEWQEQKKKETIEEIDNGTLEDVSSVEHNKAPPIVAFNLYGINKWVNENDLDFVIHIHVNDDSRKNRKVPGKYSGFSIYYPERQYGNSVDSKRFAELVRKYLDEKYNPSTLPVEKDTLIESQELIAMGRYKTLEVPAVLVEFGYIYEDIFASDKIEETEEVMAKTIYDSIVNFRFP